MIEITLKLDGNKIDLVLAGLGELPAKMSIDLINEITALAQIEKQKQITKNDN